MENRISQQTPFAYRCLHHPVYGKAFRYQSYKTAEIIHPTGAPIDEFGIVVDGILKANLYTVNGCELCSAYFEDCDVFPEFLYFTGKKYIRIHWQQLRKQKLHGWRLLFLSVCYRKIPK